VEIVPPGLHSPFSGQTLPDDLRIMVSETLASQKQEQVLIHEITHMLVYDESLVMDRPHDEMESFVSRLANLIYETLDVNDLLVEDWMEKLVDKRSEEVSVTNTVNVVERYDDEPDSRSTHEPLRSDGDEGKILTRRQGRVERHSQASRNQRPRSR
jgi:hypothetical protein